MSKKAVMVEVAKETGLWVLANALCSALATAAVYGAATLWTSWGSWRISLAMAVTLLLTATWGNWASLIWTRARGLRLLQQLGTMIPGLLMLIAGAALFYFGIGSWFFGTVLMASGLGMAVVSVLLSGQFFNAELREEGRSREVLYGLTVYPVAATGLSAAIVSAWMWFVVDSKVAFCQLMHQDLGQLWESFGMFGISTVMVSLMASALISTIVPAVCSFQCRQIAR